MTGNINLEYAFNPESVAIVGISTSEATANLSMTDGIARNYLEALLQCNFKGRIYPINPKGGEIRGLKVYANIKDIPDPVDYVICCIPAPSVPQLIKDCAAKGVKVVQFFTAGFSESGTEEGRQLEADICNLAYHGGVRLIGPNCMGVYSSKAGLSFALDFPKERGAVAFMCQSGGNAIYFGRFAAQRGVRFSKVISYGNACDIDESDLLEYFVADPETEIIAVYIEGVKDGKRFSKILKEATKVKPVVMIKGGFTEAGSRAAASHTGSLTGSAEVWKGLLRQTGVITVPNLDELIDVLVTFSHLPVPKGRRIGTIGISGGVTVVATDSYVSAGLIVPSLTQEIQQELMSFVDNDIGVSLNNPMDLSSQFSPPIVYSTIKALADYSGIDALVFHLPLGMLPETSTFPEDSAISLLDIVIRVRGEINKPLAVVVSNLNNSGNRRTAFDCQQKCHEAGIPVYFSTDSAAKAISLFLRYHENLAKSAD